MKWKRDRAASKSRLRTPTATRSSCSSLRDSVDRLLRFIDQIAMRPRPFPIDLLRRGAKVVQDIFDEGERNLAFPGVDAVRTGLFQHRDISQIRGPCQHADTRVQRARRTNHFGAVGHAGGTENKAAGL